MRNAQATRIAEVLGGLLTGQANAATGAGAPRDCAGRAGRRRARQRTSMNQGGQQGLGGSSSTSSNKGGLSGEQDRIARDDNGNQAVSYSPAVPLSRPIRPPTR